MVRISLGELGLFEPINRRYTSHVNYSTGEIKDRMNVVLFGHKDREGIPGSTDVVES